MSFTARYALATAALMVAPRPVTASTRPPFVTTWCPDEDGGEASFVPAWKTVTPGTLPAASRPEMGAPFGHVPG